MKRNCYYCTQKTECYTEMGLAQLKQDDVSECGLCDCTTESLKNAGYNIVQYEIYNDKWKLGIALGYNPNATFTKWVTWHINFTKEKSYFWGHYFTSEIHAMADYHERLKQEYEASKEVWEVK